MKNKKLSVIILAITGLAIISAVVFIFQALQKKSSPVSVDTSDSLAASPSLPKQTRDQYASVNNPDNLDETKEILAAFVNESAKPNIVNTGVRTIKLVDVRGEPLLISNTFSSIGASIPETLSNLMKDKDYDIFYCSEEGGRKDYGLVLYAKSNANRSLDAEDYKNISDQMRQWENSMFRDLHSLFFPVISFSDTELNQTLKFQNGKVRYAEVRMPDGSKKSINYKQLGDPVIITSSLDCLIKGEGYFFDTEE